MIKDLLQHLNINVLRSESDQYVCSCPFCENKKLYVNQSNGLWDCKHGCGEGNPFRLVERMQPDLTKKGIFELLGRFGLDKDNSPSQTTRTQYPNHPKITPEEIEELTDEQIETFCEAKNIAKDALLSLQPKKLKGKDVVLLPAYDPSNTKQPCGYIRAGLHGQLITLKYKDSDGKWCERGEKYPVIAGSSPGLLGLPTIGIKEPYDTIVYAEGWKDCLAARSIGYEAVANSQGAKTWRDSWLPIFKNKTVLIIFDCDAAGVSGAKKVAEKIFAVAKEVFIIELPYEYTETNGKDLHDYIREDNKTKNDIIFLLTNAVPFATKSEQALPDGVVILPDDHPDTVADAFRKYSLAENDVRHKYNRFDGWSIFRHGKYQRAEDTKEIRLHIRKFIAKCWFQKAKTKTRLKQTSGFITDVLEALASLDEVHLLPSMKAPCSLDRSLDAQHVIAANNLLIDISHRPHTTHPITEKFYTLNYLDYDYKKDVFPDKWANFLLEITQSDIDIMTLLQQWAGYLLLPTLKYQKFLLCVGDGANGKGVFFDTLTAALGQKNVSNVPLARFDNSYALYGTYGKMVNMSNENARNIETNAESIIKEYVAGDKILWEQKYKDAYFDYPTAKLMFATNELPRIKDSTDGIWRRMIFIPFDAKFSGENQNTNLAKELQQPEELAGILNWMIEGAEMLEKNGGFVAPKKCQDALNKYRNESDSARLFLLEHCDQGDEESEPMPTGWLYGEYKKWCQNNGNRPKNNVHFGHSANQIFDFTMSRPYFGNVKKRAYVGIVLKQESELERWT